MKRQMVRYTVKPERVAENDELLRAVFEELERTKPDGLRYATFRLEDGRSYVHMVSVETADGENPLTKTEAWARYQESVRDRLEAPPEFSTLDEVGSYRL
jgi:hypothetical protein